VAAIDPDDSVAGVQLFYDEPGTSTTHTQDMVYDSGLQLWQGTITADNAWAPGQIVYWVRGTDTQGNTSASLYPTSNYYLNVYSSTC
jgi:hypothetical protein